ncbi:MAG TPA: TlpA family protein disulfide reductase, partial [Catalimonadaceae bacterium]|nr:TlpA family protein disulfide reductase [Catalimonadaceae bacterium]
ETRFLTEQFPNRPAGVEFIGLAFERKSEFDYAKTRVETVINRLNPAYPIWIGGISNKDSAAAVFPAITGIAAFPTTIFVKANGQVHKVHTGFSGPATGAYYDAWKKEFAELLHEITNP